MPRRDAVFRLEGTSRAARVGLCDAAADSEMAVPVFIDCQEDVTHMQTYLQDTHSREGLFEQGGRGGERERVRDHCSMDHNNTPHTAVSSYTQVS